MVESLVDNSNLSQLISLKGSSHWKLTILLVSTLFITPKDNCGRDQIVAQCLLRVRMIGESKI